MYEKAAEGFGNAMGPDHMHAIYSTSSLVGCLMMDGQYAQALLPCTHVQEASERGESGHFVFLRLWVQGGNVVQGVRPQLS